MKIYFGLGWIRSGKTWRKNFKSIGAFHLFDDFLSRIAHFCSVDAGLIPDKAFFEGKKTWICDTSLQAKNLTSEDLAKRLSQLQDTGTKELLILIGGPNGFSYEQIKEINPDMRWNFGALTLPHELAAVVATEQIYRAWTIIRGLPYHKDH